MTILYTSNDATIGFDALATGAIATDWAAISGTWRVGTTNLVNGHSHSFGDTTATDGQIALLTGIAAIADADVILCQKNTYSGTGTGNGCGIVLRADAAYNNAYLVLAQQTGNATTVNLIIFKRNASTYTDLGGFTTNVTLASGTAPWYLRARVVGTTIECKAWSQGSAEPDVWGFSQTDSSVTAAGYVGLYNEEGTSAAAAVSISDFVVGNGYASQVTVDAPATAPAAGASFTLTGTYTGTAPTAMDVGFGSIAPAWVALTGFATVAGGAGGTWSGTASAPAAGPSWATVRDHTTTTSQAASSAFIVGVAGPSISVTTPGIQTVGATMTISGTYGGAAPTGLNFEFDSAGYAAAASPVISGGTWSFTATVPAAGTHTISVQEANATSVIATSGSFTTTTATTVAPGNAAILYSPYNWNVGPSAASTINAGAYLRVLFTGTSCTLGFNVAANLAPLSQIWWRIDDGAWTQAAVATSIACAIPAATLSNANVPYHLLEVVVKSTTETQNRWNAPSNTAVVFTGITLDAGAVVLAPLAAPLHVLVYGDSITEGVRTLGESAANDTDRNDAALGWAWRLGALLGAEVGVVGFGATGISVAGSGNVPALPTSYASIMSGVARGFTPAPDLVVFNIGTNDGTANTVAAMTAVLNGVIAACPAAVLAVLRPFNGNQAANLQAAIAACSAPAACHYINTTGFFNTAYGADSLALHPSGPNGVGRIAPQVAAALRALLAGGGGAAPKGFQGGFERGLLG